MTNVKLGKGWALALVGLIAVSAACSKKSSSSNSGGGAVVTPPPAAEVSQASPYLGTWKFITASIDDNGRCDTYAGDQKGTAEVDSAGNFSFTRWNDPGVVYNGTVDLNTGGVSFSATGGGSCGPISGSGNCADGSGCSGTYTAGTSTNTYNGTFNMTR